MTYIKLDVEQGSDSWLALRQTKITATDTAVIMGLNPWKSPVKLWEEKLGLSEPTQLNDKMRQGMMLEEEARRFVNSVYNLSGSRYEPAVLISTEHEFMMASLDGLNENGGILEIKCGQSSHNKALTNEVPEYYFAQLQKQMYVSGAKRALYFSYRSDSDNTAITVERDEEFIKRMIVAEKDFYKCMMEFTQPPHNEKHFVVKDDKEWRIKAHILNEAREQIKLLQAQEKCLENELIEMSNGNNSIGGGIRLTKCVRKGAIDYHSIESLKNMDLEPYRKKSSVYYRIDKHE